MLGDLFTADTTTVPTWALWLPQIITAIATVAAATLAPWVTQKYTLQKDKEQREDQYKQEWTKVRYETKRSAYLRFAEQVGAYTNENAAKLLKLIHEHPEDIIHLDATELDRAYFAAYMSTNDTEVQAQLNDVVTLAHTMGEHLRSMHEITQREEAVHRGTLTFLRKAQAEIEREFGR